jgi:hypothetical protein
MKKLIVLIFAGLLFILNCASTDNLTEGQKDAYRESMERYERGQRSGP